MGDHFLLVGRVEACRATGDFSDFWGFKKYKPILYTGWRDGMTTYGEGKAVSLKRRTLQKTVVRR